MRQFRQIYCCACERDVVARLTNGGEIYPHRPDLHELPFWKCDTCKNAIGCHHKTEYRTRPLGSIPTPEIKAYRQQIHAIIDPLWQAGLIPRIALYKMISNKLGYRYHTGHIRSIGNAQHVLKIAEKIAKTLTSET